MKGVKQSKQIVSPPLRVVHIAIEIILVCLNYYSLKLYVLQHNLK